MQHYTEAFENNIIDSWLVLTLKLIYSIYSIAKSALSFTIKMVWVRVKVKVGFRVRVRIRVGVSFTIKVRVRVRVRVEVKIRVKYTLLILLSQFVMFIG